MDHLTHPIYTDREASATFTIHMDRSNTNRESIRDRYRMRKPIDRRITKITHFQNKPTFTPRPTRRCRDRIHVPPRHRSLSASDPNTRSKSYRHYPNNDRKPSLHAHHFPLAIRFDPETRFEPDFLADFSGYRFLALRSHAWRFPFFFILRQAANARFRFSATVKTF
jgi:hypothetical protein